jgi:hypothetical protein
MLINQIIRTRTPQFCRICHPTRYNMHMVTVAERSKACAVFARSEAGMVGSNLTQGMDV